MPQGLIRKIFGGQILPEDVAAQNPELARSWSAMERVMPEEATSTNRVRNMNTLERFINPGAQAMTWPWGTIAVDEGLSGQALDKTLAHELTHTGQQNQGMLRYLYNQAKEYPHDYYARPSEQEAFDTEENLWKKLGSGRDINLPPNNQQPIRRVYNPNQPIVRTSGTR